MSRLPVFVLLIGALFVFLAGCTVPGSIPGTAATPTVSATGGSTVTQTGTAPSVAAPTNTPSTPITFNTTVSVGATSAIPAATSGNLYNAKIIPSGGVPPYNCSAAPGTNLPGSLLFTEPGCSITGSAPFLAEGTPTEIFPISFIVRDSNGNVGGPFQLNLVVNQPAAKLWLPERIATAMIGMRYEFVFCDRDSLTGVNCNGLPSRLNRQGTPPYTFTVSGQPLGLLMSLNGLLEGTIPRGARTGDYPITVCIRDSAATEACANTNLPVIDEEEPLPTAVAPLPTPQSGGVYDGTWSGTVSATGNLEVGYSGNTRPYSISFDLEITLKCDDEYTDESGKRLLSCSILHARSSDPFLGCVDGCVPQPGDANGRISFVTLAGDRQSPEAMAIRFPNNVLVQGTHTVLSSDGTKIIDDVSWPPQVPNSIAWEYGTSRKIETVNCADCFNAYPDHTKIELTKVS